MFFRVIVVIIIIVERGKVVSKDFVIVIIIIIITETEGIGWCTSWQRIIVTGHELGFVAVKGVTVEVTVIASHLHGPDR